MLLRISGKSFERLDELELRAELLVVIVKRFSRALGRGSCREIN